MMCHVALIVFFPLLCPCPTVRNYHLPTSFYFFVTIIVCILKKIDFLFLAKNLDISVGILVRLQLPNILGIRLKFEHQ